MAQARTLTLFLFLALCSASPATAKTYHLPWADYTIDLDQQSNQLLNDALEHISDTFSGATGKFPFSLLADLQTLCSTMLSGGTYSWDYQIPYSMLGVQWCIDLTPYQWVFVWSRAILGLLFVVYTVRYFWERFGH